MGVKSSKNIESIFPLTFMQMGMLIHNLKAHQDQGFQQVQCKLSGSLNLEYFRQAWEHVFKIHPVLRSSIHWENLEKPVQVIRSQIDISLNLEDWTLLNENVANSRLIEYLKADRTAGLDLTKAPVSRITIFKLGDTDYQLIWSCHHIIIDGWSSALIIQEVFEMYVKLCKQLNDLSIKQDNYQSFIKWYQGIDRSSMKQYWKNLLHGYRTPALAVRKSPGKANTIFNFEDQIVSLPENKTVALQTILREYRVTPNTLILATWSALLCSITKRNDVVFGTTVSGRSGNLNGLDRMAGQFSNVLPVRIHLESGLSMEQWLTRIQKQQLESSEFEYAALNQVTAWCQWPGYLPLFDSLVVMENMPLKDLSTQDLELKNFKSGITTTYPVNILVIPGAEMKIILRYDPEGILKHQARHITEKLIEVLSSVADRKLNSVDDLEALLGGDLSSFRKTRNNGSDHPRLNDEYAPSSLKYVPPSNPAEFQLTKIWEQVLGLQPLGVKDNFFELGGTSLLAVRLFDEINKITGRNLPPSMLLQHPTIASLAQVWNKDINESRWSSLVPLRASGSKPPLFTIHGGGGHVFFYQPLARYLDPDQPVFALQPVGLDGETEKHQSIGQMARHYLDVIKSVQPEGPFSILGTCLSDPICVEINNLMRQKGESPIALVIVDSSPFHLFPRKKVQTPKSVRLKKFRERFKQSPFQSLKKTLANRITKLIRPVKLKWEDIKIEYGKDKPAKILLDMRKQLQKLYYQYNWAPFEGKVTLIKTSQNLERLNNWDEGVWAKLVSDKVDLLVIPGEHYTRFEEPDVIGMASQLQEYLDALYEKQGSPAKPGTSAKSKGNVRV